ncbi:hypothetical protein PF006_g32245 [Phytophthora fragariae]|uniref:Uncharacterized protein n=1 Tax=Phytophthora fragariae TaxID=53985 RepID=A0A6A3PT10_9STRA|nr:hypothetical protein PF003_g17456 [Phytophthora fragariae]KAE9058094.1 hypothetical protein PF006_g32245 [Phytophthora fragariae]
MNWTLIGATFDLPDFNGSTLVAMHNIFMSTNILFHNLQSFSKYPVGSGALPDWDETTTVQTSDLANVASTANVSIVGALRLGGGESPTVPSGPVLRDGQLARIRLWRAS